ncbi:WG repeat-containing protein [Pseudobacteroides cellulosolvens]|uniref:S-layer domain-containing protein n=1 Tax=Pseudobacteroides cellulosolvens ATCC 35603 = DSM 2933 TaxID=398512 RepID=A0A0L6JVQ6_9FIRM|nr:WG repeat-containing protein [Pseudobacteroides cellulosolvens]KNY29799.1 S-layer domain-containing protein [Pseudobacteroides cellulosolvens ATCC 35603 = DSM 2933]
MRRRLIVLFLILSFCFNQLLVPVFAENEQEYTYTESNGEITITKYTGPDVSELSIPGTIDGKPVTSIADSIFIREESSTGGTPVPVPVPFPNSFEFTVLKKIIIPENVKSVGRMFSSCDNLQTVEIPSTVTEIKDVYIAFMTNRKLQSIDVSKNNLNYSSENGILFNKDKSELIYYPRGKRDTEYTIPRSVTDLGPLSIRCDNLISINIHENVKDIFSHSINGNSLELINVSTDNPHFTSDDGILYNKDKTIMIKYPQNKSNSDYIIPSTVNVLSSMDSNNLKTVTIPESVYEMPSNLSSCTNLQSIAVHEKNTVYSSEDGVLFDKAKLKLISYPRCKTDTVYSIPLGVEKIPSNAFNIVNSITRVNVPSSVTSLDSTAFFGCTNLKSMYFYGDAPEATYPVSFSLVINKDFKFYYAEGSKGFTNPWKGFPAESFEGVKYEVISTPKWEQAHPFSEGLAAVVMDTGDEQLGKRWGYIDTTGQTVISPKYLEADDFNEGVASVKNGTIKFIDKTGKVVLDSANLVNEYTGYNGDYASSAVCSQGIVGFNLPPLNCTDIFDINGTFAFGSDESFKMWLLPFSENVSCGAFYNTLEGSIRNGFIDINHNIIYPEQTEPGYLYGFDQGLALAGSKEKNGNIKFGFIDKSGKYVVVPQFDNVFLNNNKQAFFEGLAVVSQNNKWGAIDKTGKYAINPVWDNMHIFKEGLAWVEKDNKWGCIDKTGNVIIKPSYDSFTTFANGIALVRNNGKFCFIDKKGNYIGGLTEDIDNVSCFNDNGIIQTMKNNLFGAIKVLTTLETPESTATPAPTKLTISPPSNTHTPVPTVLTPTPTSTPAFTPILTPTNSPVPTYTITPFPYTTDYPTPTFTATATPTPSSYTNGSGGGIYVTGQITYTPTPTHTPIPTLSAAISIPYSKLRLTSTSTNTPTRTPTNTPTSIKNATPSGQNPSLSSAVSNSPTATPTAVPTITPSATPTAKITVTPSATPALETEPTKSKPAAIIFKDIQSHWAKIQITELVGKNVISGYENGTFRPDNNITRAELAVIIVKVLGLKLLSGDTKFNDDNDIPAWAKAYINTAAESGIISGYGDNTFKSDKPCSRQEIVVMIMRAFKFGSSNKKLNLKDSSAIQNWARDYITKAIELQIIKGYEDMTFKPEKNVTRAEAAAIVSNSLKKK